MARRQQNNLPNASFATTAAGSRDVVGMPRRAEAIYDTGNRLERYTTNVNAKKHLAYIANLVAKRSEALVDTTISAMNSSPERFDLNLAALSDLIAGATTPQERRLYEKTRDKIIQGSMPGFLVGHADAQDAMRSVINATPRMRPTSQVISSPVTIGLTTRFNELSGLTEKARKTKIDEILADITRFDPFAGRATPMSAAVLEKAGLPSAYRPSIPTKPLKSAYKNMQDIPLVQFLLSAGNEAYDMIDQNEDIMHEAWVQKLYYKSTGLTPQQAEARIKLSNLMSYRSDETIFTQSEIFNLKHYDKVIKEFDERIQSGSATRGQVRTMAIFREKKNDITKAARQRIREQYGAINPLVADMLLEEYVQPTYALPSEIFGEAKPRERLNQISFTGKAFGRRSNIAAREAVDLFERGLEEYRDTVAAGNTDAARVLLTKLNRQSEVILADPRVAADVARSIGRGVMGNDPLDGILNPASLLALVDPESYFRQLDSGDLSDTERLASKVFGYLDTELIADIKDENTLYRSPAAKTLGRVYGELQRMRGLPQFSQDQQRKNDINMALEKLRIAYQKATGLSKSEVLKEISRSPYQMIRSRMNKEAALAWADIANATGGVVIQGGDDAELALDRALLHQRGYITSVNVGKYGKVDYMVALQGLDSTSTGVNIEFNPVAMRNAGRAARATAGAKEEVEGALRAMRTLGKKFIATDEQIQGLSAGMRVQAASEEVAAWLHTLAGKYLETGGKVALAPKALKKNKDLKKFFDIMIKAADAADAKGAVTPEAMVKEMIEFVSGRMKMTDFAKMLHEYNIAGSSSEILVGIGLAEGLEETASTAADVVASQGFDLPSGNLLGLEISPQIDDLIEHSKTILGRESEGRLDELARQLIGIEYDVMGQAGDAADDARVLVRQLASLAVSGESVDADMLEQIANALEESAGASSTVRGSKYRLVEIIGDVKKSGLIPGLSSQIEKAAVEAVGKSSQVTQRAVYDAITDAAMNSRSQYVRDTVFSVLNNNKSKSFNDILKAIGTSAEAQEWGNAVRAIVSGKYPLDYEEILQNVTLVEIDSESVGAAPLSDLYMQELSEDDPEYIQRRKLEGQGADLGDIEDLEKKSKHEATYRKHSSIDEYSIDELEMQELSGRVRKRMIKELKEMSKQDYDNTIDAINPLEISDEELAQAYADLKTGNRKAYNRAVISRIYRSMKENALNPEERSAFSRMLVQQGFAVDDLDELEVRMMPGASSIEDAINQSNLRDYFVASGKSRTTGKYRQLGWMVGTDGKISELKAADAAKVFRMAQVGDESVTRASQIAFKSVEAINMQMANMGITEQRAAETMARLMPEIAADEGADSVLQMQKMLRAMAYAEREGLMADLDINVVDFVAPQMVGGKHVLPTYKRKFTPLEAFFYAARGTDDEITETSIEVMKPVARELGDLMREADLGGLGDEFFDAAEAFRQAAEINIPEAVQELMQFNNKAPILTKVGIGAIAVGAASAMYRLTHNDPYRTEEFLQYDHPGSAGVARVSPDGSGYAGKTGVRGTPIAPAGASQATTFKGFKGSVVVTDNMDSMSANELNRMMDDA